MGRFLRVGVRGVRPGTSIDSAIAARPAWMVVLAALLALHAPCALAGDPPPPVAPPAAPIAPPTAPVAPTPPPKPLTPEQAADAVLAAVKVKDDAALKALAAKDDPDPWLVADELFSRHVAGSLAMPSVPGDLVSAAEAFVKAALPRKAVEGLAALVAKWRPLDAPGLRREGDARALLARLAAAVTAKDWEKAQSAVSDVAAASELLTASLTPARLEARSGEAFEGTKRWSDAIVHWKSMGAAAESLGWLRWLASARVEEGGAHYEIEEWKEGVALREEAARLFDELGDAGAARRWWSDVGEQARDMDDRKTALRAYARAAEIDRARGDMRLLARHLGVLGLVQLEEGLPELAMRSEDRALEAAEASGDLKVAAFVRTNMGNIHANRGRWREAKDLYERALGGQRAIGDRFGASMTVGNLGNALKALGDYRAALDAYQTSLDEARAMGNDGQVALALGNLAELNIRFGRLAAAEAQSRTAIELNERIGQRSYAAWARTTLGNVFLSRGDARAAAAEYEAALAVKASLGDRLGLVIAWINVAEARRRVGDVAGALGALSTARKLAEEGGFRDQLALVLGNLGQLELGLGRLEVAEGLARESLSIYESLGMQASAAYARNSMGNVLLRLGDFEGARRQYEAALSVHRAIAASPQIAVGLNNIASTYSSPGDAPKRVVLCQQGVAAAETAGDQVLVAIAQGNLGVALRSAGRYEEALKTLALAQGFWIESGDLSRAAYGSAYAGTTRLLMHDDETALGSAREGLALLDRAGVGLSDDQGSALREQNADLFSIGSTAAARLKRSGALTEFVEAGRAGNLLEALGGREKLRGAVLPEELLRAEGDARAGEAAAARDRLAAVESAERAKLKVAGEALDAAREKVREAIERIEREAKRAAGVIYQRPLPLEKIEALVRADEALVLYQFTDDGLLALVVGRGRTKIVALGQTADVLAECEALHAADRDVDPTAALDALRKRLVEPLALGGEVKRVLVSPDGAIGYIPFAPLVGARDIGYVPSGTVYGLLLEEKDLRGNGVLALGDPDYETERNAHAAPLYDGPSRSGHSGLRPLPGTREEANAVGTFVRLGKDASEAGLADALATRPRWRSVHLACHGLVNVDKPMLSALALTPDPKNDGYLTVLEVMRSQVPADLVVLSACETGKGKIVRGEGIVGLTRAFMFAGAPRVICSLWKVDDEATRALMTKFYELWNPKDASKAVGTGAALKAAQEFVKSQEKWKHPYYWAAWVLWGLPE